MKNNLLVVIVTYNAMPWIEKCINSALASSIDVELFIVDNGSTDGTIEHIRSNYPDLQFIVSPTNLGFGRANNLGLQYAVDKGHKYVYLLNQDAWVMPETFKLLIESAESHSEYGILSPLQVQANMQKLDVNFSTGVLSHASCPSLLSDLLLGRPTDVYGVQDVMAAHWLITRNCMLNIGGFSPSFPHYGEDCNYTERVRFHGLKIGVVPMAIGVHDRENRKDSWRKKIYIDYICVIRSFSSPLSCLYGLRYRCIWVLIKDIVKFRSFIPLSYLSKLLLSLNSIKLNRETSKVLGLSFLNGSK